MNRDRRYNQINGMRNGKSVYILGSGSSLKGFDFSRLDNKFTIAINHTIEHYNASALIFGDKKFVKTTTFDLDSYEGLIFASEDANYNPVKDNVYIFKVNRSEPIANAKIGLYHCSCAGLYALNLAVQMKAKKIYLLGYDFYKDPETDSIHFYSDYEHHRKYPFERYERKCVKFKYFEQWAGLVYNCNPKSKLTMFQFMDLGDI